MNKFALISKVLIYSLALGLVCFIVLSNFAPFGMHEYYAVSSPKKGLTLSPDTRVYPFINGDTTVSKQTGDLVYFSTPMNFKYDAAKIRISYKNSALEQLLYIGFQDQDSWHYNTKILDNPLLNPLNWYAGENQLLLYQKGTNYDSVAQFIDHPPVQETIGSFNLDKDITGSTKIRLDSYVPSTMETVIDTPLRGRHILYVYVENERFRMKIQKQDLNRYEGEDPVTVDIYKEGDLVFSQSIKDDGVTDTSGTVIQPQDTALENPGDDLPEPGVYKVVLDASGDTLIKSIRTNLHKIVFESPIFPVEQYPSIFYTDANYLKARTAHNPALQTILVHDPTIDTDIPLILDQLHQDSFIMLPEKLATTTQTLRKVTIPQSDVMLSALPGYFAFAPEQWFLPIPFQVLPIRSQNDIDQVNYILADYKVPEKDGEWSIAEAVLDLSTATVREGKLSWLIKAPGLKENNREILIKDIELELIKEPLINVPFKLPGIF